MTKSVYRFLSNDRVDESEILAGHFSKTQERITACDGPILMLHDTTEFTYKREAPHAIGHTRKLPTSERVKAAFGAPLTACGILMHASLAITPEGLPLGLGSIRFWARQVFKNTQQMKRKVNPTRVPIEAKESIKWIENLRGSTDLLQADPSKLVHVGDRESDIYEFFCECERLGSHFLIRSCVNRLANETTIAEEMVRHHDSFQHAIHFVDSNGGVHEAKLQIKVKPVELHPPIGKQADYPTLKAVIVSAIEEQKPADRERIRWTLAPCVRIAVASNFN